MSQKKYRTSRPRSPRTTTDEQYFRRHKKLVRATNSAEGKKYLARLEECRNARRCHLWACPECWKAREQESCATVEAMFDGLPLDKVAWITCLLEPRDAIYQPPNGPRLDMEDIRHVFAKLRRENPDIEIVAWGRYELKFERRNSTPFLRSFRNYCYRSQVLIPHFHGLVLLKKAGKYLSPPALRTRLQPHFPGHRQLKVGRLKGEPSLKQSLRNLVGYTVKGQTSSFRGSGLREYVKFQTAHRTDAWFLKMPSTRARGPAALAPSDFASAVQPQDVAHGE